MSYYYTSVKRLAALRLRLSQLEGKLKFAIRRGIRHLVLAALFAIESLEHKIYQLTALVAKNVQAPIQVIEQPTGFTVHSGMLVPTYIEDTAGNLKPGVKIPTTAITIDKGFTEAESMTKLEENFETYINVAYNNRIQHLKNRCVWN